MTRATELESRGNVFTLFTGCAQIYHQRWYVRSHKRELKQKMHKIRLSDAFNKGNSLKIKKFMTNSFFSVK